MKKMSMPKITNELFSAHAAPTALNCQHKLSFPNIRFCECTIPLLYSIQEAFIDLADIEEDFSCLQCESNL